MDILGQSSLLVGVTSFALGLSILARNVKNKLFIAYSVLTLLISLWGLSFFLSRMWDEPGFYRWHLIFNLWLAPAGLGFIHVMVRIQDTLSKRLRDIAFVAAMGLTVCLLFNFSDSGGWVMQSVYFLPIFIFLQILELMWIDRRLKRGMKRTPKMPTVGLGRRNLIYSGGLLVLATCVMDHVPYLGRVVPALGNLGLIVYLFFISQAITRQRLMNFGAMVSRFLVLVVVAMTLTGLYSLLVGWIENSPALFFLNSFIASFLILMLLDPLRVLVRYATQRLLTQKQLRMEAVLREAQRKLATIVDPASLFSSILNTTEQFLHPEWAALFVLRSDGTKYRRVRTIGTLAQMQDQPTEVLELLANQALLEASERLQRRGELPILLDQILENEIDRSASRVQRESLLALIQGLKAFGANLLIPLIDDDHGNQILGFVAVRVLSPPEAWENNWGFLSIIYPFYSQAAQSMRKMEVFVRQREKERLAALGEMAAGLAHEIRNPLGAIKGAAQYLDPSPDKPEARFLSIIVEEVDRLNRVVTQFLDYSKPPNTDFKPVDITKLAEKTIDHLRPSLPEGMKLEFQPPGPGEDARVMAVSEQLQQVLLNLVQNSVKALDGRPDPLIRVAVEVEGKGNRREVSAIVEDNGKGIKREHLEKLFIPFFTTSPSGTGLGLSISQKIIEAHRGRIDVYTEEGRLTRFSVVLPYAQE
jgi:signal transduction histidine kinase